jgi:hypothetical protein
VPPVALNFARWLLAFVLLWPLGRRAVRGPRGDRETLAAPGRAGPARHGQLQRAAVPRAAQLHAAERDADRGQLAGLDAGFGALLHNVIRAGAELPARPCRWSVWRWSSREASRRGCRAAFRAGRSADAAGDRQLGLYSWLLARPPAHLQGEDRPDWDWAGFLLVQIAFGLAWCGAATGLER